MNELIQCFYYKFDETIKYDNYHKMKKIDIVHLPQ